MFIEECPKCGSQLKIRRWREDDWIVEELKECPMCGWTWHWAYGRVIEDGKDDTDCDNCGGDTCDHS